MPPRPFWSWHFLVKNNVDQSLFFIVCIGNCTCYWMIYEFFNLVYWFHSIHPYIPHAVFTLGLITHFMDYIHMWHEYNPWADDVLPAIFRSIGQSLGHTGSNFCGRGIPVDHWSTISSLIINIAYNLIYCLPLRNHTLYINWIFPVYWF